jgi:hypothetical protein
MKKLSLLLAAVAGISSASFSQAVGPFPGCPGAFGPTKLVMGTVRNDTTSAIKTNTTWVKDTIYIIRKLVRVAPNATLTLNAGTIVMGFPGPLDTSALIIKKHAKINALGTSTNPVVMTSCKIQGARNRGDWGGFVICGDGVTNLGVDIQLEGHYGGYYGGTNTEDNSGTVQFTRVEFAGFAFEPNVELNGITLGAVGAKTVLQNIQVSNANDDSIEWFGGQVNSRNLIAWKGIDDDFDTDNGYSGISQFGIGYRDYSVADFSGSHGFEADNDATGDTDSPALQPKQTAIFSNFEMYGPFLTALAPYNKFFKAGAMIRRNSEEDIYNTLFLGYPGDSTIVDGVDYGAETCGIFVEGDSCAKSALAGRIRFKKNSIAAYTANPTNAAHDNSSLINADSWVKTPAFANTYNNDLFGIIKQIKAPLRESPLFALNPGSDLLTGSSFTTAGLSSDLPIGFVFAATPAGRGFASVAYRGAVAGTEWAAGWTHYNPNLLKYKAGTPPTREGAVADFLSGNSEASMTGITCSPNPTVLSTEISFIQENEVSDAAIVVMDMAGSPVYTQTGGFTSGVNTVSLNTSSLQPGTYIVRVSGNGTNARTTKLSVVR